MEFLSSTMRFQIYNFWWCSIGSHCYKKRSKNFFGFKWNAAFYPRNYRFKIQQTTRTRPLELSKSTKFDFWKFCLRRFWDFVFTKWPNFIFENFVSGLWSVGVTWAWFSWKSWEYGISIGAFSWSVSHKWNTFSSAIRQWIRISLFSRFSSRKIKKSGRIFWVKSKFR